MTEKQKRFCDEYIKDLNASRAYKAAYPNVKNDNVARANSSRLLTNANIKAYIEAELEKLHNEKTATAGEVIEYLTSVMRREETESVVVVVKKHKTDYDGKGGKTAADSEEPVVVEIPARVADANKAAEMLGKYYALFTDRTQVEGDGAVKIINDIPRNDDKTD